MNSKKANGYIFIIIGLLLMLTLVACFYFMEQDKDLVPIEASVTEVDLDNGKYNVTATYEVDNLYYQYDYVSKDWVKEKDKVNIYYHSNNVSSVKRFKTSKLVFLCPTAGLLLCIVGLTEIVGKSKKNDYQDFKTKVVNVQDDKEKLKIMPEEEKNDYVKLEEEIEEIPVKVVVKKNNNIKEDEPLFKEVKKVKNNKVNKLIPKYFYVTNDTLVCEFVSDDSREISLNDIKAITKTINKDDKLIKLVVASEDLEYVLTNMKDVDLEAISNTLHNKIIIIDPNFREEVLHKEY